MIQVTNTRVEDDGADGLWLVGAEFLSVIFPRSRGGVPLGEAWEAQPAAIRPAMACKRFERGGHRLVLLLGAGDCQAPSPP